MMLGDDDNCDVCGLDPCGCRILSVPGGAALFFDKKPAPAVSPAPIAAPVAPAKTAAVDPIQQRFDAFHKDNPHVMREALRLGRAWLDRGDKYISTKAILETLRTTIPSPGEGGYRINNDFSAPMSRWLATQDARFKTVLRTRTRK